MLARLIEGAAGALLVAMTLRDVFDTVVVPGGSHGALRVVRRWVLGSLPLWKRVRHRGIGVNFAPATLVASFLTWMALLVLAFALMAHALRDAFSPALDGFGHALYVAGSAICTIGTGDARATGLARIVVVGAGLCGLAVMTLAVTYLLEVQSNIGQRDTGLLKITTSAGHPPSALGLLERYGTLDAREQLPEVLRHGRDWCAGVMQSHASHPSLIYFRSAGTGSGWPAALGALVDLALILEDLVDEPRLRGAAVLLREQAVRLSHDVTGLIGLEPGAPSASVAEVDALCRRLRAAGYSLRETIDAPGFIARRADAVGCIDALSQHLGMPPAPLVPKG